MERGRPKNIKSPEHLWELFTNYRDGVKAKPRYLHHLNIKTGEMVKEPREVPLTIEGFYNYVANQDIMETMKDYFSNRDNRYNDFVPICSRVKAEIRQDQIEGGMAGQYNPSITQRLNGLTDKQEVTGADGAPLQLNTQHTVVFKHFKPITDTPGNGDNPDV